MPVLTNHFYGSTSRGAGRTVQDFGLCDTKGTYLYTAKLRTKGLLVVVFFSPDSLPSQRALAAIQSWSTDVPMAKWNALAVAESDRETLAAFGDQHGLADISLVVDYELYQTRSWGVSHLPSTYLIAGKTGRILGRVIGDDPAELAEMKTALSGEIAKLVAAEEAAKEAARLADEAKKAEEAKKAAAAPAQPAAAATK